MIQVMQRYAKIAIMDTCGLRCCIRYMLVLMVFVLQGCALSYTVKVNGFLDPVVPSKIKLGSTIHVVEDKEAKNPLLDREIAGKIDNMLKQKGYRVVSESDNPVYYVLYGYGIGHEKTITRTMPMYTPGGTATVTKTGPSGTSYSTIQLPGKTTYVPYTTTVTDKWLSLKIIDGEDYRKLNKNTVLWIGEASVTGEDSDLRGIMDYLIAGISFIFGENTGREVNVKIRDDDPELKKISRN